MSYESEYRAALQKVRPGEGWQQATLARMAEESKKAGVRKAPLRPNFRRMAGVAAALAVMAGSLFALRQHSPSPLAAGAGDAPAAPQPALFGAALQTPQLAFDENAAEQPAPAEAEAALQALGQSRTRSLPAPKAASAKAFTDTAGAEEGEPAGAALPQGACLPVWRIEADGSFSLLGEYPLGGEVPGAALVYVHSAGLCQPAWRIETGEGAAAYRPAVAEQYYSVPGK